MICSTISNTIKELCSCSAAAPTAATAEDAIYVIGYYGHGNLGDEQYLISLKHCFSARNLVFVDIDKLATLEIPREATVILGGGDVLNDYFLDRLARIPRPVRLIAFSVGIPYEDVLYTDKLDMFDAIFLRAETDMERVAAIYPRERLFYMPDASWFLLTDDIGGARAGRWSWFSARTTAAPALAHIKKPMIAVSLNRHFYTTPIYRTLVTAIAEALEQISFLGYTIVFVPFNTKREHGSAENDCLFHNDVISAMNTVDYIKVNPAGAAETLEVYSMCRGAICMRFHSCLFALYQQCPFLPIFETRKIKNLLSEIGWSAEHSIELAGAAPSAETIVSRLIDTMNNSRAKIPDILAKLSENMRTAEPNIIAALSIEPSVPTVPAISRACDALSAGAGPDKVLFELTGNVDLPYRHGLAEKMSILPADSPRWREEFGWLLQNYRRLYSSPPPSRAAGMFNITFMDQNDYSKVHRAGWQFVYENLRQFHTTDPAAPLLDLYIDRTFHWKKNVLREVGVIPYRRPWMGFIHHTFDTTFSSYNCEVLFQTAEFLESLPHCRRLFVLSEYLAEQVRVRAPAHIEVVSLIHPTELVPPAMEWRPDAAAAVPRLLHVGAWLRNIFFFYQLTAPAGVQKVCLKGAAMDNYFPAPAPKFLELFGEYLAAVEETNGADGMMVCSRGASASRDHTIKNNWYHHFYDYIEKIVESVEVLDNVDNDRYDVLLSRSVVFIYLIDASAVNTLLECIVRNTPVMVNRHPAAVELLGDEYPLYYDAGAAGAGAACDLWPSVGRAHEYLKAMDKSRFTIQYFIENLLVACR